MNKLIIQTFIFISLVMLLCYYVLTKADGYTDPMYVRFTTPRQSSLILGTSQPGQSLQPQILNRILNRNDFFNYAFTIEHSPYGLTYYESIKKKLDPTTKNGIFILELSPWSVSSKVSRAGDSPNDESKFGELEFCLNNTPYVNINPNPFYLLNNYDGHFFTLLPKKSSNMYVHPDGWLEVSIEMDSISVKKRTQAKLKKWREYHLKYFKYSSKRMEYLSKTIALLKQHGTVYLVRLPTHPDMMAIENLLIPDFDSKIQNLIKASDVKFYDMAPLNADFKYTDGSHLYKKSGAEVTKLVANWIKEDEKWSRISESN